MGDLSPNLLAALRKRGGSVRWLFQINWWDGTELISDAGNASREDGFYKARVESWGELDQGGVDPSNGVKDMTFGITYADVDGAIRDRVARAEPLFQTTCAFYLAADDETLPNRADWWLGFSGFLDTITAQGRGVWSLEFRGLNVLSQPTRLRTITAAENPHADPAAIGQTIPMIWGLQEGVGYPGSATGGACPTFYINNAGGTGGGFLYLVAAGWVDVLCVYRNNVPVNFGTGFTIVHQAGATYIKFTSTQGTATITCDVRGYDTNGDGTGTLIEAPLDILVDLTTKLFSPNGTPIIDVAHSVGPDPRAHAYGGYILAGNVSASGAQLVSDAARSFNMFPFILGSGLVAFGREIPWPGETAPGGNEPPNPLTVTPPWLRYYHDEIEDLDANHAGKGPQQVLTGQDMVAREEVTYAVRANGGGGAVVVAGDALARAGNVAVDQQTLPFLDTVYESFPDSITGLRSWIECSSLAQVENDEDVSISAPKAVYDVLCDLSNNGRIWTPQNPTQALKRGNWASSFGIGTGLPGIEMSPGGGGAAAIVGPNANVLLSPAAFTFYLVFKINGISTSGADGATTNDCVIDFPSAHAVSVTLSTLNGNISVRCAGQVAVFPYALMFGQVGILCVHHAGGQIYIGANETRLSMMGKHAAGNAALGAAAATIGQDAGAAGFLSQITFYGGAFYNAATTEASRLQGYQYFEERYLRYPTAGVARTTASARELARKGLRSKVTFSAPLEWLDSPLFSQINIQDPDVAGSLGPEPWQRRPLLSIERKIQPAARSIQLTCLDAFEELVTLWISARADQAATQDLQRYPGLAVYPNVILEPCFADPTANTLISMLEAPWTDQAVLPVKPGRLPLSGPFVIPQGGISSPTANPLPTAGGLWIQSRRTNTQLRSSAANATPLTGLTIAGGGVTADTAEPFLDPTISAHSIKLVVTGAADQTVLYPNSSIDNVHGGYLSLDWKPDTAGAALQIRIHRVSSGLDYNPATGLFSETSPFFFDADAWEGHRDSGKWGRFLVRLPPAATIAVQVKLPGTLGNGATAHVAHVQPEANGDSLTPSQVGVGSRIVNDASQLFHEATSIRIYNGPDADSEQQIWPLWRGTAFFTVALMWDPADIISDHPVFDVPYDGLSNAHYFRGILEYNAGNPRFAFHLTIGLFWSHVVAAIADGVKLTKTGPTSDGWSGGAISSQVLSGNGWCEFIANAAENYCMFGLGPTTVGGGYPDYSLINYAIEVFVFNQLNIFELGALKFSGTYATGDILRVEVVGTTVTYKQNGSVIYTSLTAASLPLACTVSMYFQNGTIDDVSVGGVGWSAIPPIDVASYVSLAGFHFGDVLRLACRWTSLLGGELGLPPRTATAFVKRMPAYDLQGNLLVPGGPLVKGNDVTYAPPGTLTEFTALHLGGMVSTSDATVQCLDSVAQDVKVFGACLPDDAIERRA